MDKINPILYQEQMSRFPQIQHDYGDIKKRVDKENKIPSIFDIIPTFRSIENVPNKINHNDLIPAAGFVSLAILNGPEDLRDMKSAYKQMKSFITGNPFEKPYNYRTAQHPFSFFRGTLLQSFVNPRTSPYPKLAKWLLKNDTTLWNTKLKNFVVQKFNIQEESIDTNIKNITHSKDKPSVVKAKIFKTKSLFGELTARAMTRTTKLGTLVLGGLEAAHLVKEVSENKNIFVATKKSTINFASSLAGIGYGGAIGAKYFGAAGSIIGMGLGAIVGNNLGKILN